MKISALIQALRVIEKKDGNMNVRGIDIPADDEMTMMLRKFSFTEDGGAVFEGTMMLYHGSDPKG